MRSTNPIPIVPVGTHTSSRGRQVELTVEDLREAAAGYDPQLHEAPITIGHPKENGPAFGWFSRLFEKDGMLYGDPIQVAPEFAELVNKGRFKKRSASLYPPDYPGNPTPGKWYLRHVGFLGAQAPAIKGLPDYSFSDGGDPPEIEFSEGVFSRFFRNLRELLIEKYGPDVADRVVPSWLLESDSPSFVVDELKRELDKGADSPDPQPAFSEAPTPENSDMNTLGRLLNRKIDAHDGQRADLMGRLADAAKTTVERVNKIVSGAVALPTNEELASFAEVLECDVEELKSSLPEDFMEARRDLDRREAEVARRERANQEAEQKRARGAAAEFCEELADAGRILPRHVAPLSEVLCSLGDAKVEFAEGEGDDAETVQKGSAEILREFLESLPQQIDFKEKSSKPDDELAHVNFTAPAGASVDSRSLEVHQRAVAYQAKHPNVDYSQAVEAVTAH